MPYPDRTLIAALRRDVADALANDAQLMVSDREHIAALAEMMDVILRQSVENEPLKLELIKGIGPGICRALRARGIVNLVELARAVPDDLREFCLAEGVFPRGYEQWPGKALDLIREWDESRLPDVEDGGEDDDG